MGSPPISCLTRDPTLPQTTTLTLPLTTPLCKETIDLYQGIQGESSPNLINDPYISHGCTKECVHSRSIEDNCTMTLHVPDTWVATSKYVHRETTRGDPSSTIKEPRPQMRRKRDNPLHKHSFPIQ